MSSKPIGIFDSGVGGLSIWKEIRQLLPLESTLYLSDSKHAPYGPKGSKAILELSIKNTEYLIDHGGCKLIVVACNTATTNAVDYLRANYSVPFIGIEPAIKPAALQSKTKAIGILATKGTLSSRLFHKTSQLYSNDLVVVEQVGNGIVELIEKGGLYSKAMRILLSTYLAPMIKAKIDFLVLGCTHYHFLTPILKELLPNNVNIIDSAEAVARQTKSILELNKLSNNGVTNGESQLYTNGEHTILNDLLKSENVRLEKLDF
jgi:glutamate racemase|tara:strand:- start:1095 stop:1880 length:786 start_codon:yes stop_codon:yes gene_type:complete